MKQSKVSRAYLESLLLNGYSDELRKYSKNISMDVYAVSRLKHIFCSLQSQEEIDYGLELLKDVAFDWAFNGLYEEISKFLPFSRFEYPRFLNVTFHGESSTFEIGWVDPRAGYVVWDRLVAEVDDPVTVFVELSCIFEYSDYKFEAIKDKKVVRLYHYHPERFRAFRNYPKEVGKLFIERVRRSDGMMDVEKLNMVARHVIENLNAVSLRFPRKLKDSYPAPSLVIDAEMNLATAYGRFVQAGRQIIKFSGTLSEMLDRTDVGVIPLNSIKLPYASQYIFLGKQAELEIEDGWFVDGAYVEQRGNNGEIRVTLTAVPDDIDLSEKWYLFPEVEYTQDFAMSSGEMNLDDAISSVLNDNLASLRAAQEKKDKNVTGDLKAAMEDGGLAMPEGLEIIDRSSSMAVLREEITLKRHEMYRKALRLIVNSICYMIAYPDDIATEWLQKPSPKVEDIRRKTLTGKTKDKNLAKSKLAELGYSTVHICGRNLDKYGEEYSNGAGGHGRTSLHWRRGHWRNQAHGQGMTLRKLIWVMPMLIGAKGEPTSAMPRMGHLYLVS